MEGCLGINSSRYTVANNSWILMVEFGGYQYPQNGCGIVWIHFLVTLVFPSFRFLVALVGWVLN